MAKLLQVRVSVVTWDEVGVTKQWPNLTFLVWPDGQDVGLTPSSVQRGVLELLEGLENGVVYTPSSGSSASASSCVLAVLAWTDTVKDTIRPFLKDLYAKRQELEAFLADWKPFDCSTCAESIEECLDELEKQIKPVRVLEKK